MNVEKEMIQTIRIFWDYFWDGEISEIEERLPSVPIREEDVKAVLQKFDIDHYIHGITMEELTGFIVY